VCEFAFSSMPSCNILYTVNEQSLYSSKQDEEICQGHCFRYLTNPEIGT
jgi:hypothetical protein